MLNAILYNKRIVELCLKQLLIAILRVMNIILINVAIEVVKYTLPKTSNSPESSTDGSAKKDRLLKLSRQSGNENDFLLELETYYVNLFIECFYESQSSFTDEIKLVADEREWWISIDDGKTTCETSCENYFVNHYIKSGKKLSQLNVVKKF
ncbi:uncharacterized protein LOC136076796 isoform X2 [Hydra vulgaris]|uniref:Uncharacterized protein LOC136076796 isoform X2 n=1 Tax=Hydra vulgaris TaxID=6087 RepID=A0ABM4BBM3_HYDVU